MVLSSKTFQIFKSINTGITMPTGGTTIARFYSSWVIRTSLLEEISAALAATATATATSATPCHPQVRPPCLMLPSLRDKSSGDMVYRFFNPINKKIFKIHKKTDSSLLPNKARCFWSSHGSLAFVDPRDSGLYLRDPFSVSTDMVIRLPSMETFPVVVRTIRKSYNNRSYTKFIIRCQSYRFTFSPRFVSDIYLDQLVSSSALHSNNKDCLFMAVGDESHNLLFCKPGDAAWTALSGPLHPYRHIIPSSIKHNVFYARSYSGHTEAWDLRDLSCIKRTVIDYRQSFCTPKFCELEANIRATAGSGHRRYLVESSGDLLLVCRYLSVKGHEDGVLDPFHYKTIRFDVYKMDFSLGVWTYVNSLGDRALFVGSSNSFSLHVCDYPGLRSNSIYFADDYLYTRIQAGHDMGVYNLEDNSIEPFYPFGNLRRIIPAPFWIAPNPHSGNVAEWFA